MEEKGLKKQSGMGYLVLALLAFGGLGMELVTALWLEPLLFGGNMQDWTPIQNIIHWVVICVIWGVVAFLLVRTAKNSYGFDLFAPQQKMQLWQWGLAFIGIALAVWMAYASWGGFKFVKEFQKLGALLFLFQYIYYAFETALFTLIIVFGQKACEIWFKNGRIPYGGFIAGVTWGLAHIFTKGSVMTGILSMLMGFLFGAMYLIVNRDIKKAFVFLFFMFVL